MADKRKLQGEIERCLKAVAEHVEVFEEIWQKVHTASNANQKEKYEADLKKEIKKLQRLRDQIKTWLAGDVKTQRQSLLDNRRLVEVQMERFKVVERETKTKAYSKEGLAAATKVDPAAQERAETREWLNESIDTLQLQVDKFEAEIENILKSKKKTKRQTDLAVLIDKHKMHIAKLEMLTRLLDNMSIEPDKFQESLKDDIDYYIANNQEEEFNENEYMYEDFEEILAAAEAILLAHGDDGVDEEDKEDGDGSRIRTLSQSSASSNVPVSMPPPPSTLSTVVSASSTSVPVYAPVASVPAVQPTTSLPYVVSNPVPVVAPTPIHPVSTPISVLGGAPGSQEEEVAFSAGKAANVGVGVNPTLKGKKVTPIVLPTPVVASVVTPSVGGPTVASAVAGGKPGTLGKATPVLTAPSSPGGGSLRTDSSGKLPGINFAAAAGASPLQSSTGIPPPVVAPLVSVPLGTPPVSASGTPGIVPTGSAALKRPTAMTPGVPVTSGANPATVVTPSATSTLLSPLLPTPSVQQQQGKGPTSNIQQQSTLPVGPGSTPTPGLGKVGAPQRPELVFQEAPAALRPHDVSGHSDPIPTTPVLPDAPVPLGVPGAGHSIVGVSEQPVSLRTPSTEQGKSGTTNMPGYMSKKDPAAMARSLQMLQGCSRLLPEPIDPDQQRPPPYAPRNPCRTPAYYPQQPPTHFSQPSWYSEVDIDTLFFIFYYQQGTYPQYLAAKELKKQAWRFHKKYLTWFQRHEEPKHITDEFEQGTYVYFDYESGWCQRKKTDFTFEYKYLDDQELA